jgi:hypothetical protein
MESLVALLFNVVITISSFLFSSSPCCLFFMDFPSVENRTYIWILLYWKVYEITFPTCGHSLKTEFKQGSYVCFTSALCAVQNWFQDVLHYLGITTCKNLRLLWFLNCWNFNFMGLLNIQKYLVFSLRDHAEFWWDRWLLAHWSGDVDDLDLSIF